MSRNKREGRYAGKSLGFHFRSTLNEKGLPNWNATFHESCWKWKKIYK